jgi:competence protein ComEC
VSVTIAPAGQPGLPARLGGWAMALVAAQRGRYAPWLAVALGAGLVAYFDRSTEPGPGALWAAAALALAAVATGRRWPGPGWLLGLASAGCLGFGAAAWHAARLPPPLLLPFGAVIVSGTVAEVEALPEGRRVTLSAPQLDGGEALSRHLRIRLRADDPARPEPGQRLSVRASLREPGAPAAPGAWDFQRAAFFTGLAGRASRWAPRPWRRGRGAGAPSRPCA